VNLCQLFLNNFTEDKDKGCFQVLDLQLALSRSGQK